MSAGFTAVSCPTCGGPCKVIHGGEGTSYYEPFRGLESHEAREAIRTLWEAAAEEILPGEEMPTSLHGAAVTLGLIEEVPDGD